MHKLARRVDGKADWERSVVLVLLAVILVVAFISYRHSISIMKEQACQSNRAAVIQMINLYELSTGKTPGDSRDQSINALVREGYMKKAPHCPDGGRYYFIKTKGSVPVLKCSKHDR